ncbi:MAG: hypothetical protein Q8K46_02985 [Deltaproteobacteria bacterium]|nr:hypothetical protein [Deltaproteobacteria bacterium]
MLMALACNRGFPARIFRKELVLPYKTESQIRLIFFGRNGSIKAKPNTVLQPTGASRLTNGHRKFRGVSKVPFLDRSAPAAEHERYRAEQSSAYLAG